MNKTYIVPVLALAVIAIAVLAWPDAGTESVEPPQVPPEDSVSGAEEPSADAPVADRDPTRESIDGTELRPVAGIVIGPDGGPVAGAVVTLREITVPWPHYELRRLEWAYTGADGRFEFAAPEPLDLLLEVTRDGLAKELVPVAPEVRELTIRMAHGFEVTGFVQDPRGQLVREGVDVCLEPGTWGTWPAERTTTDSNGQFRFQNVPAGLARLTARSDFYQPATAPMVTVGSGGRIALSFDAISLVTRGRVVGPGMRPVAGAEVMVFPGAWNGGLYVPIVDETDEAGRFKLRGLGPSNLRFEIRHPDYSVATRGFSARPGTDELVFELFERVSLSGRLRGADVAGVHLRIRTAVGEQGRAAVGDGGEFAFPDTFSTCAAAIEIEGGVLAFERSSSRYLDVTLDEFGQELELEVVAPSRVRGRVFDAGGQPVAGVHVTTPRSFERNPERVVAVTDDDGRYELCGLPPGRLRLEYEVGGLPAYERNDITVPAAGQIVEVEDVTLVESGEIAGRVVRGGEPVPGAIVFVGRPKRSGATVTGPDGRFVRRGLIPGNYRVKARYSTLPLVAAGEGVEVRAGETTEVPELVLPAGRRVVGLVTEPNGRPISDALLHVPGQLGSSIYADSRGRFEIEVSEDAEELQVWAPDFSVHRTLPIRGGELVIQLPIVKRSSIRARVVGLPQRSPVTAGIVRIEGETAESPEDPEIASQRHVAGRFVEMPNGLLSIDWVPVGRSQLTLQCQGFAPFMREIDLAPHERLDLEQVVLEPGAEVHGRVVDSRGEPIAGAAVFLGEEIDMFQRNFRPQVKTDTAGHFHVSGVTPASRRIVVWAEGYAAVARDLEIPRDLLRPDSDPLSIELRPSSWIVVEVLDAEGRPTDERIVGLKRGGMFVWQTLPDAEGRARFRAFGPGEYEVVLFGEEISATVEIGEREQTTVVTLQSTR